MIGLELLAVAALLFACIAVQAITLTALQRQFPVIEAWVRNHTSFAWDVLVVYGIILTVIVMHVVQASIWALFFQYAVGIASFHEAFYHSLLALTTMDDGSDVLPERWQMLGAAAGLTGWMVFSWSTAWTFLFLTTLRDARKSPAKNAASETSPP